MSKLLELADRVEALTGPNREIDKQIWVDVLGMCPHDRTVRSGAQSDIGFDCLDCGADSWGNLGRKGQRLYDAAQPYTASLDAAMTLVPEAISGHMTMPSIGRYTPELWQAGIHVPGPRLKSPIAYAKTPALALCAAALRARHAVEGEDRG